MSSQFWQDEEGWLVVFSYGREHTWTGTQPVSRPLDTLHTGWPCPQNIVRSLSHRGFHLDNLSSLSVIDAVHSVKYCKVAAGCMHHLANQVKCAELAQTCTESINIMLGQAGWVWKSLWISICLALTNGELRTYVCSGNFTKLHFSHCLPKTLKRAHRSRSGDEKKHPPFLSSPESAVSASHCSFIFHLINQKLGGGVDSRLHSCPKMRGVAAPAFVRVLIPLTSTVSCHAVASSPGHAKQSEKRCLCWQSCSISFELNRGGLEKTWRKKLQMNWTGNLLIK